MAEAKSLLQNSQLSIKEITARLANKVALVSGASRGIGARIATELALAGCCMPIIERFEHPQYFNKLFKSKTGVTPVEFRQLLH